VGRATTFIRHAGAWAATRLPELALVVFALVLRVSLARTFDVSLGYDFAAHQQYIRFIVDHGSLPPYDLNFSTYNPPLFYALAALMVKAGFTLQAVGRVSIVSSCIQVLLVWLGLELYLRESRLARVLALALAAVIPAGLHIAGFCSNQALSDVFCVGAIVLLPQVMLRSGRDALGCAAGAGACLGLALLTKITGSTVLGAFLVAVGITLARSRPGMNVARRLLPATAVLLSMVAVISGWHYVRHKVLYGKFVLIAYDAFTDLDPTFKIPYLDRRTFGFVSYWDETIYEQPYWPSASHPRARFWPMLVVTTFSDYYNFAFVPLPAPGDRAVQMNGRSMRASAIAPSRRSVMGGTALALLAAAAWLISARRLWRRGDDGRLVLLLVGLFAVLGQLHFAVRFSNDNSGPIKGAYLQSAAPVYCALVGLAIATLWNRRRLGFRLLALGGMIAIASVAAYSIYAKVVVPLR
jgi:hypothetical protein